MTDHSMLCACPECTAAHQAWVAERRAWVADALEQIARGDVTPIPPLTEAQEARGERRITRWEDDQRQMERDAEKEWWL